MPGQTSVVLDVCKSEGGAFRLVAVYTPKEVKQLYFLRLLEVFFSTSRSSEIMSCCNAILVVRLDRMGLIDKRERECKGLTNLLSRFQLSDRYQQDFPNALLQTLSYLPCI